MRMIDSSVPSGHRAWGFYRGSEMSPEQRYKHGYEKLAGALVQGLMSIERSMSPGRA